MEIVSVLSALIAALSALAAIRSSRRALELERQANLHASEANLHIEKANTVGVKSWTDQYFFNVREWADEGCNNIAKAIHLNDIEDKQERVKQSIAIKAALSALIDRGRWYFPNQWQEEIGTNKETAYRGIRQKVLDPLVYSYDLIKKPSSVKNGLNEGELVSLQRRFVSRVQEVLDPRKRDEEVAEILRQFEVSEKLREAK